MEQATLTVDHEVGLKDFIVGWWPWGRKSDYASAVKESVEIRICSRHHKERQPTMTAMFEQFGPVRDARYQLGNGGLTIGSDGVGSDACELCRNYSRGH